jgi:hypothetical protein
MTTTAPIPPITATATVGLPEATSGCHNVPSIVNGRAFRSSEGRQ